MKEVVFLGLCSRILCCAICCYLCFSGDVCEKIDNEMQIEENIEIVEEVSFIKPIEEGIITSYYGQRKNCFHYGIDLADDLNTNIYASYSGEVIFAGYSGSYGNLIKIRHKDGYETYYAHCNKILVKVGDVVSQGDLIAKMGSTGNATGSHVHFEIRLNGKALNPYEYIIP